MTFTDLKDGKRYSKESIRGRFLDAINYLTLIYTLIIEPKSNDEIKKKTTQTEDK